MVIADVGQEEPRIGAFKSGDRKLATDVEQRLRDVEGNLKVAVMGCVVNGPGEAKDADVGIACGRGRGVIFRKGEKVRTVEEAEFEDALMHEIRCELAEGPTDLRAKG